MVHWILMCGLLPIFPVFLILWEAILEKASKSYHVSLHILENVKVHVAQFIQSDIGLEAHIQLIVSTILLLLVNSSTRTFTGLEVMFENETIFYLPPNLALILSITWSLLSCISSHVKGISKKRNHSTTKSLVAILAFTSASIFMRVFSYVSFFTPSLGLFNCLRHLQGEMFPFGMPLFEVVYMNDTFYFGDAPRIQWSQITRWNYKGYEDADPPDYTLYSSFTIEEYFWSWMIVLVVNMLSQMAIKRLINVKVFQKMTLLDSLLHSISCCFIPHPMEEWDEEKGTVSIHIIRKKKVFKEMMVSMMINFVFNIVLLSPLIILGKLHNLILLVEMQ